MTELKQLLVTFVHIRFSRFPASKCVVRREPHQRGRAEPHKRVAVARPGVRPVLFIGDVICVDAERCAAALAAGRVTKPQVEEIEGGHAHPIVARGVDSKNSLDAAKIGNGLDQLMGPPPAY